MTFSWVALACFPYYSCVAWSTWSTKPSGKTLGFGSIQARQRALRPLGSTPATSTEENSAPSDPTEGNVVFRPSSKESDFDSYKIGSARIHRYIRDDGGDGSEYVMWYHGRSLEQKKSETEDGLVPLSTGRIGTAYSRNGLHWERPDVGSLSEDVSGVSLGLNKESWWGFDTAHVGLGQVLLPMSTPAVLTEGGVYIMYYMGGSHEEQPLTEYIPASSDGKTNEKTIKGMNMKIGVALSQDGKSWGRVEGDDPTGAAVVPGMKENSDEELYCAWPDVVLDGELFHMYYSTMLKENKEKVIVHAESKDGFRWEKTGVCLKPSTADTDLDCKGISRCVVSKKHTFSDSGTWVENDNEWVMFYEGVGKDGKHRILRAESNDGISWSKAGLVLDVANEGAWDCKAVGSPDLLRLDDGSCRLYYTGVSADGSTAIGVATGSSDCAEFTRETVNISFA